ncbi:MAG TPA: Maf family protein, partial [Rhizomicrobium sp.]|nr:Maf family protein [Rhizomicrobium sp.]
MLRDAGVVFDVRPAHVDEDAVKESLLADGAPPGDVADALAELKAIRISTSAENNLVLGADQVLAFEDELISKVESLDAAKALLRRLSGKRHELISAAVLARGG